MRVALDTSVLVYAEGVNGAARKEAALRIVSLLPSDRIVVPVQALAELFNVLTRKAGLSRSQSRAAVLAWHDAFATIETSSAVLLMASDLSADHELGIWDAIIFSAAVKAGCRLLLSPDLAEGFTWNGVTVVNPFTSEMHPLLAALLSDSR